MPASTEPPQKYSVPPSAMPLISPNALLQAHLKQSPPTRSSQRSPSQARPIDVNIGSLTHCNGSSLVKIGSTTIVCGVRAELLPVSDIPSFRISKATSYSSTTEKKEKISPSDEDERDYSTIPLHHLLVPNLELATGCSPNHLANSPPSVEAQSLSQRILSLLHSSKLVRTSDLSIHYTPPSSSADALDLGLDSDPQLKAYWVLYIDMVCISYGGSIFDAAWLALYAALRDTVLPKAWWDADQGQVVCSQEMREAKKLSLRGMPVPCSFAVFVPEQRVLQQAEYGETRHTILVDADVFEEECCQERCCVSVDLDVNQTAKILRIEKNGGSVVGMQEVKDMLLLARRRWEEWNGVLQKASKSG